MSSIWRKCIIQQHMVKYKERYMYLQFKTLFLFNWQTNLISLGTNIECVRFKITKKQPSWRILLRRISVVDKGMFICSVFRNSRVICKTCRNDHVNYTWMRDYVSIILAPNSQLLSAKSWYAYTWNGVHFQRVRVTPIQPMQSSIRNIR